MFQFKLFPRVEDFTCDNCRGRFYEETAYSVATNWEEFDRLPTFCFNCATIIEKRKNPVGFWVGKNAVGVSIKASRPEPKNIILMKRSWKANLSN